MEWEQLLSEHRMEKEEDTPKDFDKFGISELEKDYRKIINSSFFRRLQDKTQVFPLDKSDFIRTRLTHSLEVSTLAKQLGLMVSKNVTARFEGDRISEEEKVKINDSLMCAGLLHDIGNPPFGHFGEVVIGEWFKENLDRYEFKGKRLSECLSEQMKEDLCRFDGNAQAFRILTKLRHVNNNGGLNLTNTVLNTLMKYPVDSLHCDENSEDIKKHKLGYFFSEKEVFEKIVKESGTMQENFEVARHPLTFLLEAADDVAYATADLEDGFKKGLFKMDEFVNFFKEEQKKKCKGNYEKSSELIEKLEEMREQGSHSQEDELHIFLEWIEYTRNWLLYVVAYDFTKQYNKIMGGNYQSDLFHGTYHEISIGILKKAMKEFVYDSRSIITLELAAKTIINFLLDHFVPAVIYYGVEADSYVQTKADKKFTSLISDNFKQNYENEKTKDENYNLYLRLLLVNDYVSGMTDSYAKGLYQQLNGIY